ncbi:MAG: Inner membrane protein YbhL [Chlamydiae bacterium]|nr:Inner membrane protein YbhL [Chlamydiota bacterium]
MGIYDQNYQLQDTRAVGTFSTRVYAWMSIGLGFTAMIAYLTFRSGLYLSLMPFWMVLSLGTFGVAMAIQAGLRRFSVGTMVTLFLSYSGLQGLFFGTLLPVFAANLGGGVIWSAFFSAGAIFALAMGYGLFTKNDLTSFGRILTFGLIGLIGISLVFMILSFFLPMQWAYLFISYLGLALFVGLTAYDAQTIRSMSLQVDVSSAASYKLSLVMALKMYLNVIMIFWYLLQIFSSSSRR